MDISILDDCKFATCGGIIVRNFKKDDIVSDLSDSDVRRLVELKMAVECLPAAEIDAMEVEKPVVDAPKKTPAKKPAKKK